MCCSFLNFVRTNPVYMLTFLFGFEILINAYASLKNILDLAPWYETNVKYMKHGSNPGMEDFNQTA